MQHHAPDDGEAEDTKDHAHEPQVEPHVAVENVAELVRDHALEFVAIQQFHAAARHADDGVIGCMTGGEGVDAAFIGQQVNGRHGHAGGERHLLDDVEQLAFVEVVGVGRDALTAEHLGDGRSAAPEFGHLEEAAEEHDQAGAGRHAEKKLRLPESTGTEPLELIAQEDAGEDEIQPEDNAHHRRHEVEHEPLRVAPRAVLSLKKVHVRKGDIRVARIGSKLIARLLAVAKA